MRHTRSLCPICYTEVPAVIYAEDGMAIMDKLCSGHGRFKAVVERDVDFYDLCLQNNSPTIYPGHFVDVTTRCNLKCRYCYYETGSTDIPLDTIQANCRSAAGPYILTGGEPTLRPDIHEVIDAASRTGETFLLTNGYGLQDRAALRRFADQLTGTDGFTRIALSFHPEAPWLKDVLLNIAALNLKLTTMLFVIDSLDQLPNMVAFMETVRPYFGNYKIKIASSIGAEKKSADIDTSDVVKWFGRQPGNLELPPTGKITYYPLRYNNLLCEVVNWYNVDNIDLLDIDTPPTYTTKDGRVMDLVKAMVLNEAGAGTLQV